MDLKEEAAIGGDPGRHWYYIAKGRAINALLGHRRFREVLDVGAGSGVFSRMLIDEGCAARATCVDPNYSDRQLVDYPGRGVRFVRGVDETSADLVLMIDVIEHVDDDVGLVAEYARLAPEGAEFLVSVPAFPFLWSSHDDFLEHRRRYTIETLEATVRGAGLEIVESRYFFGLLFPAVAALRLASRALQGDREASRSALKAAPDWLNKSLVAVHDLERAVMFPRNRVAGVTAFCRARKAAKAAERAA